MFRRMMVFLLCFLFVSVFAFPLQVNSLNYPLQEDYAPIVIYGNEDLIIQASEEGWEGTGDAGSPIFIENVKIKSDSCGIRIEDVSLYFSIKNCLIEPNSTEMNHTFGILILNCNQSSIEECVITGYEFGITLHNADHVVVYRTEIVESVCGVFVNECNNVWLHSLDVIVCDVGIRLNHTYNVYIDQTIIDYPIQSGIECLLDTGTLLRHNVIYGPHQGVLVSGSENWVMEESVVHSCDFGIDMIDAYDGYVIRSMIMNCSMSGIKLSDNTGNITIVECWLGPSNFQNAQDDGAGNNWCLEYDELGNYWSDYDGSGHYLIPGKAESIDLYPLSLEDAPEWEDVVTGIGVPPNFTNPTDPTTNPDTFGDLPAIGFAAASVVVVLLVAVLMLRSRTS